MLRRRVVGFPCIMRFDLVVWVDALERKDPEPESSCTVSADMADVIIDNNGPEENLVGEVAKVMDRIMNSWNIEIRK